MLRHEHGADYYTTYFRNQYGIEFEVVKSPRASGLRWAWLSPIAFGDNCP